MKKLLSLLALIMIVACSSSNEEADSIEGNWLQVSDSGTSGVGLSLTKDAKYAFQAIRLTSNTSAQAYAERGTYYVSGSTLWFNPTDDTCHGTSKPITVHFAKGPNQLTLVYPDELLAMSRNFAAPATNFTIALGCFDVDGKFTRSPLEKVR